MSVRVVPRHLCIVIGCVLAFGIQVGNAGAAGCTNEAIREAQGVTALPDCMALEMVSPPRKNVEPAEGPSFSSNGNRVRFRTMAGLAETPGLQAPFGDNYVATRGSGDWVTAATSGPTSAEISGIGGEFNGGPYAYAADLARWNLLGGTQGQVNAAVFRFFQGGLDSSFLSLSPLLVPIDESGSEKLASEMSGIGAFSTSADLSTTVFASGTSTTSYLPGDPPTSKDETGQDRNNYVVSNADGEPSVELLARDKSGKIWGAECGAHAGGGAGAGVGVVGNSEFGKLNQGDISADGSRIFLSTRPAQPAAGACGGGTPTTLPLRILTRINTPTGPEMTPLIPGGQSDWEEAGDDLYQGASADGAMVYFTTVRSLVATDQDSGAECASQPKASIGCDLYLYDAAEPPAERLIQVSAGGVGDPSPGKGADVLSSITAISGDGSHVYFVAEGVLTGENAEHKLPAAGQPNFYLYERDAAHPSGDTAFIGTLDPGDRGRLWGAEESFATDAYTTPLLKAGVSRPEIGGDGHILTFVSQASLAPDDKDGGYRDVYRYDAATQALACISCSDSGIEEAFDVGVDHALTPSSAVAVEGRWVSDDGQTVVFSTAEPLTDDDGDGVANAYVWQAGQLSRLPGAVGEASPTVSIGGEEVAYATRTRLLPQDRDTAGDVYVSRVGGGFPGSSPPAPCVGEACQGDRAQMPAQLGTAFVGGGNPPKKPLKCGKGFIRKHGKCAKKPHKPKKKQVGHKGGGK